MPNPIRRSKIERYSEPETLAKIAAILHFDMRQASGDIKQAVFQGALDSLAKGDMVLKADIEYRMSVLRPRKTSETTEASTQKDLPVINYTPSIRVDPYADFNPYMALLLYGPQNFPMALKRFSAGSYKAMIPLVQRYHPGTKPRSFSNGHDMYEYIVSYAGKDYDRVLHGEIPIQVNAATHQAYYYDKTRRDVGRVQPWPPPEQEKAAAGRRQESGAAKASRIIASNDLVPVRTGINYEFDPFQPPDSYFLLDLYGDKQLQKALERYHKDRLLETVKKEQIPGISKTMPREQIIRRMVEYRIKHPKR